MISVDIPCGHCRDLLKRDTWVFEERMLECRVCKGCQERCASEIEKQKIAEEVSEVVEKNVPVKESSESVVPPEIEAGQAETQGPQSRDQARVVDDAKVAEGQTKRDSVLQDDDITVA
jgi:heterodisulfide reductase subunit C